MAEMSEKGGKVSITIGDWAIIRAMLKMIRRGTELMSKETATEQYVRDSIETKAQAIDAILTVGLGAKAETVEGNDQPVLAPEAYWIKLKNREAWVIGILSLCREGEEAKPKPWVEIDFGGYHFSGARSEIRIDTMIAIPPPKVLAAASYKEVL